MLNKTKVFLISFKNFLKNSLSSLKKIIIKSVQFIYSWWRAILFVLAVVLFLYYPIGALIVHNIDNNTKYNFPPKENQLQSSSVKMMSYIIDREVNQKTWTPNLPFFFPSAILDNMPNFQLGMFDALADFSSSFSTVFPANSEMKEISELISYPGTIWMFSPENKITPTSSANRMYREARRRLKTFDLDLISGKETFARRPSDLTFILRKAEQNINKSVKELQIHINEEKNNFFDRKSDDVFFYNQGKIYAYFLLLNALEQDYREIIVSENLYDQWTVMIKDLEEGSILSPRIVRNGRLNSIIAPNHLLYLAFYSLKAGSSAQKIVKNLERQH